MTMKIAIVGGGIGGPDKEAFAVRRQKGEPCPNAVERILVGRGLQFAPRVRELGADHTGMLEEARVRHTCMVAPEKHIVIGRAVTRAGGRSASGGQGDQQGRQEGKHGHGVFVSSNAC